MSKVDLKQGVQKKVKKWLNLLVFSTIFGRRESTSWMGGQSRVDTPPSAIDWFISPSTVDIRRSIVIYPNLNPTYPL